MGYPPNEKHWEKGDFVLHRADAKQAHMLMVVTGYTRSGLCKTRYVEAKQGRKVWENDVKHLLDPRAFNLEYWSGSPVLVSEPKRCPVCGGRDIEVNRSLEDDEYDEDLARKCGFDISEGNWWVMYEDHSEFAYQFAMMVCENDECSTVIAYGERGYLDQKSLSYTAKAPSPLDYPGSEASTKERAEAERQAQEAAGQQKLFEDKDVLW